MAFSWDKCTVIKNNKNKTKAVDCYKVIYEFNTCLTPNIITGLRVWLCNKMSLYGSYHINVEDVRNDIIELLGKCCNTDRVTLLMRKDVADAEPEILMHIKKSIDLHRYRGIFYESLPMETYEEYTKRHIMTSEDVEDYLKGVPIFD